MTDENKYENEAPTENDIEEVKDIADDARPPDEYVAGEAEELDERVHDGDENGFDEAVVAAVEKTEQIADESEVVQAWDEGIKAIEQGLETLTDTSGAATAAALHHEDDHFTFMGRTYDVPVYTGIFAILGVLTLIEVLIAEIFTSDIKILFLVGIGVAKAALVVWFYMHLNRDSRLFALALLLPTLVAILSVTFAVAVPPGSY